MQGKDKKLTNYEQTSITNILCSGFVFFRFASIYNLLLICFLVSLLIAFWGCSAFSPPTDYYQKTLEMEKSAGRSYKGPTSSRSGDTLVAQTQESTKVVRLLSEDPPIVEVITRSPEEDNDGKSRPEIYETNKHVQPSIARQETEIPPIPPVNISSSNENNKLVKNEPISVSSEVIKNAFEFARINVRSVELVNGRMEGGKNSIRVNFICESAELVNEKFFAICAVIYHLNKSSKTIDIVIGIAEDSQSNLLGALQSNIEDITAWMDNKITRAEWFSRVIKKML